MTSSKMVLIQYVVSKSYDWHWKRTKILVFCRGYDNVLTLFFFNLQKRSLACRQPGTSNTLTTMIHWQAFLFVTWQPKPSGPPIRHLGRTDQLCGFVNCIMVHWNKFDVCDFNSVYKEGGYRVITTLSITMKSIIRPYSIRRVRECLLFKPNEKIFSYIMAIFCTRPSSSAAY